MLNKEIEEIFKKANSFEKQRLEIDKHINSCELLADSAGKVNKLSSDLRNNTKLVKSAEELNEVQRRIFVTLNKELIKFDGHMTAIRLFDSLVYERACEFVKDRKLILNTLIES